MSNSKSHFSAFAPGKIMLIGEWAVLRGHPCVVLTLDKGITATVKSVPDESIAYSDYSNASIFVRSAVNTVKEHFAGGLNPFSLQISSDISSIVHNGETIKLGLGSSAAVVVAVIKSLLGFYGYDIESDSIKKIILELSSMAHRKAQGSLGSGYDVASVTYADNLLYKRFDHDEVSCNPFEIPKDMHVCVGFVGRSADTRELLKQVSLTQDSCKKIALATQLFIDSCRTNDRTGIGDAFKQSREALRALGESSGVELETSELKKLCDIAEHCGGFAKFSGAGGGDCGIAICFDSDTAQKIMESWAEHDILPIAYGRGGHLSLNYDSTSSSCSTSYVDIIKAL